MVIEIMGKKNSCRFPSNGDQTRARVMQVFWLGDLDSNQDSQIQSLESYQLDDLPADGRKKTNRSRFPRIGTAAILPI